jgi:uncharacterized tellurite resistance protein B-like protein
MFERLKALLPFSSSKEIAPEHAAPMAATMLLLEVAWADHEISDTELESTRAAIQDLFGLSPEQVQPLVEQARAEHEAAISMYPFTRAVNETLTSEEKRQLIVLLWRLAGVDSSVDVHEEHTIRRIADLLYVSHDDFIEAKHEARRS